MTLFCLGIFTAKIPVQIIHKFHLQDRLKYQTIYTTEKKMYRTSFYLVTADGILYVFRISFAIIPRVINQNRVSRDFDSTYV